MGQPAAAVEQRRMSVAVVAAVNAVAAWAGAVALVAGAIDFIATLNARLPFDSPVIAGVALACMVAVPLTVLAWAAWTGSPRTSDLSLAVGIVLIGWILVQVAFPGVGAGVAEGATARTAADKAWLSDAYGWRGWLQEQIGWAQYGVTDHLTEAGPPMALRSAAAAAADTPFLPGTAGDVEDEGRAAAHIRAGAPDRVTVWEVQGAGHVAGLDARPQEWEDRVVAFLDEHLT